jgi:hypothetical protein
LSELSKSRKLFSELFKSNDAVVNKRTQSRMTSNNKSHESNRNATKQICRRDDSADTQNTKTKTENRIKHKRRRLLNQFRRWTRQTSQNLRQNINNDTSMQKIKQEIKTFVLFDEVAHLHIAINHDDLEFDFWLIQNENRNKQLH